MTQSGIKTRKPLKPGTKRLKRSGLKPGGKPLKQGGKIRPKAKPKGRRGGLEAETEKRVMAAYRGQRCIICLFLGITNIERTCGHHIVPKSRCRAGRHNPANIVPLCPRHHKTGNDCCPHSSNPLASAQFDRWLERWMPMRFDISRELDGRAKGRRPYTINEAENDHAFWEAMETTETNYADMCEAAGVEAYADAKAHGDGEGA